MGCPRRRVSLRSTRLPPGHPVAGAVHLPGKRLLQRIAQDAEHLDPGIGFIVPLYQGPGGILGAGMDHHLVDRGLVLGPFLPVAPVLVRDLETLIGHLFAVFEAAQLFFLAHLEPELEQDGPALGQLRLELVDLGVGAAPFRVGGEPLDALHQHPAVPGTVVDGDVSGPGDVAPETPQVVVGLLLVGGGRDGNGAIEAGVDGVGEAADGAPFPTGVDPLEDQYQRTLFIVGLPGQLIELRLQRAQLRLISLPVEGPGQVELIEQSDPGAGYLRQLEMAGGGRQQLHGGRLAEANLDGVQQGLADGEVPVVPILRLDQIPGRNPAVGMPDNMLGDPLILMIIRMKPALFRQHLPAAAVIPGELLQAGLLALLGEVEPELDDQCAIVDEHALEVHDAIEFGIHLGVVAQPPETLLDQGLIPTAEQDGELPTRGDGVPEPPVARSLAFLVGLVPKGEGTHAAGIQPLVEAVDDLSLTGPLDARDEDNHRDIGLQQLALHFQELGAQCLLLDLEGRLVDRASDLRCLEHGLTSFGNRGFSARGPRRKRSLIHLRTKLGNEIIDSFKAASTLFQNILHVRTATSYQLPTE